MTTLAPRRRPVFAKRGRSAPHQKLMAIAAVALVLASTAFSAGVKIGAKADQPSVNSMFAANLH